MSINQSDSTEIFDIVVAKLLSELKGAFPIPVDITADELGPEIVEKGLVDSNSEDSVITVVDPTIEYLLEDGIISKKRHYSVHGGPDRWTLTLTNRGHKLLGEVPSSVDVEKDTRDFGQRFADALEKGKTGLLAQLIRELRALSGGTRD